MNHEKIIDLTGSKDEIRNNEFNEIPTTNTSFTGTTSNENKNSSETCTGSNNLDVFDYLADTEDTIVLPVRSNNINRNEVVMTRDPLTIQTTGITKTTTTTSATVTTRFVPNKIVSKRQNNTSSTGILSSSVEQKSKESSINNLQRDAHASNPPVSNMTPVNRANNNHNNNPSERNDRNHKRRRVNYDMHNNNENKQKDHHLHHQNGYERSLRSYDKNASNRSYHPMRHQENMDRRRTHDFNHSHRFPPTMEQYERDVSTPWQGMDDRTRQHDIEQQRRIDTQRIAIEQREIELAAKENETEKAKIEWEEQKATMVRELDLAREALNMDRAEYEKKCTNQTSELELRRSELEEEMSSLRATMEHRLSDLQNELERKHQQMEHEIQKRREELDARNIHLTRQQSELDARLSDCFTREKIIADFHVYRQSKENEFETQRETIQLKQMLLTRQYEEFKKERESHRKQVEVWNSNTATEKASLNQRIVDFNKYIQVKTTELDNREREHVKRQSELDARTAEQRKRQREFNDQNVKKSSNTVPTNNQGGTSTKKAKTEPIIDNRSGKPVDYIIIDSDDEDHDQYFPNNHKKAAPSKVPTKSANIPNKIPQQREEKYKSKNDEDYNYSFTNESAFAFQERLFREAAERMRAARPSTEFPTSNTFVTITTPMHDIAERYPQHWTWKDPYAILGLPPNASIQLIKSQYRRLARKYHPDKSPDPNTTTKFHSISSAYHKLAEIF